MHKQTSPGVEHSIGASIRLIWAADLGAKLAGFQLPTFNLSPSPPSLPPFPLAAPRPASLSLSLSLYQASWPALRPTPHCLHPPSFSIFQLEARKHGHWLRLILESQLRNELHGARQSPALILPSGRPASEIHFSLRFSASSEEPSQKACGLGGLGCAHCPARREPSPAGRPASFLLSRN